MVDKRRFNEKDHKLIAEFVVDEWTSRRDEPRRKFLETKVWPEIDRQIRMEALQARHRDGTDTSGSWMSAVEMPSQADALGILSADIRRLIMPNTNDWYEAHGVLEDEWAERFKQLPLIKGVAQPVAGGIVDQDTADMVVKVTLDHWHKQYDYRGHWDSVIVGALKRGTYAGRMRMVKHDVITTEVRDVKRKQITFPVMVPVPIDNLYLDHSPQVLFHEGVMIAPNVIRTYSQKLDDLKRVKGKGYLTDNIKKLDGKKEKSQVLEHVKLIEMEGDIIVPRTTGESILLTNFVVTVSEVGPTLIRMEANSVPFRSYFHGVYETDDDDSPYGASPLTRGRPLQEALSEVMNRVINVSILNGEPPTSWSGDDAKLTAAGGPIIAPGEQWESDDPDSIKTHEIGDPAALWTVFSGIDVLHERTTKVNDPRRGGETKSHTTGFAKDVELSRSLLPTEDFVTDLAQKVESTLYMEYALSKKALSSPITMFVRSRGLKAHLEMTKDHLPEDADFTVEGARGILTKNQRRENFGAFVGQLLQIDQIAVPLGQPASDYTKIKERMAEEFDIQDAGELITGPEPVSEGAEDEPSVEGGPEGAV